MNVPKQLPQASHPRGKLAFNALCARSMIAGSESMAAATLRTRAQQWHYCEPRRHQLNGEGLQIARSNPSKRTLLVPESGQSLVALYQPTMAVCVNTPRLLPCDRCNDCSCRERPSQARGLSTRSPSRLLNGRQAFCVTPRRKRPFFCFQGEWKTPSSDCAL